MANKSWIRGNHIGSGSFGTVNLANDKSTGRVFAVKSVSPVSSPPLPILSLENEIEILKKVNSPYIVSYIGDDTTKEVNYVTCRNLHMEFVPGGTIAELAVKRGGLEEKEMHGYARCLTQALHYLHSVAGIVHCDVKGQNLLVGSGPDGAKLTDFGSAKNLADMEKGMNWIGGTPYWMAPEVARGERPSPASDVWSLGCTIIEMATGSHPWAELELSNTDLAGSLFQIGYGGILPKYPINLSNDGRDFLDKCLKLNPIERWSCEKLLHHPFLADVAETNSTNPSPRCILDWDNEEFGDESEESDFGDFEEKQFGFATERLRSLCSEEESMDWSSDGWETVGWGQEEEESTVAEIWDFERGPMESGEMSGEGVSEASGNWVWEERSDFGCCNCDCGEHFCCDSCCKATKSSGPGKNWSCLVQFFLNCSIEIRWQEIVRFTVRFTTFEKITVRFTTFEEISAVGSPSYGAKKTRPDNSKFLPESEDSIRCCKCNCSCTCMDSLDRYSLVGPIGFWVCWKGLLIFYCIVNFSLEIMRFIMIINLCLQLIHMLAFCVCLCLRCMFRDPAFFSSSLCLLHTRKHAANKFMRYYTSFRRAVVLW